MDILEIMKARHSVRQYSGKRIESGMRETLAALVSDCNTESGLNIQIIFDEPKCFDSMMAHYGKFSGVENYIALVGKKEADLDEKAGYYGEKLVLKAQELGLNTCWVAMTLHRERHIQINLWNSFVTVHPICRTGFQREWRQRCLRLRQ